MPFLIGKYFEGALPLAVATQLKKYLQQRFCYEPSDLLDFWLIYRLTPQKYVLFLPHIEANQNT